MINKILEKLNNWRAYEYILEHKKLVACCALSVFALVLLLCVHSSKSVSLDIQDYNSNLPEVSGVESAVLDDNIEIIYNNDSSNNSSDNTERSTISIEDSGRSDPFLPDSEISSTLKSGPRPSYDLLPPPETITSDTTATELMTTKVSGIMYDRINPSAIININDSDYLVRTGDVVNNYKVLSIGRDTVTVQYGSNVYKAGVGELFTGDGINYNTISNLEGKFGGAKNIVNRKQ